LSERLRSVWRKNEPTREALSLTARTFTKFFTPTPLLFAAAVFHLLVTLSIYAIGRVGIIPDGFDRNGIAVSFASDGRRLRDQASILGDKLAHGRINDWRQAAAAPHIKFYSFSFAVLQRLLGANILSAEPLNALCYLTILIVIFNLGVLIFNRRVGLIAAVTVALWPSFLLHTTQLLKDPMFLVGMLTFILINLYLLCRNVSWIAALMLGAGGGIVALFTWLMRDSMGQLLVITGVLGAALLVVRQVRERKFPPANIFGIFLLIVLSLTVVRFVPRFKDPWRARDVQTIENIALDPAIAGSPSNAWPAFVMRIGKLRDQFIFETQAGRSNVDSDIHLTSASQVISYLPRATMIGFFAPFPNMWFETREQAGTVARRLSGFETIVTYVIESLAIVGLFGRANFRQRLAVWFLWLIAAMGMVLLGLVVVNMGTLYRLRYIFLLLLIVLAANGASRAFDRYKRHTREMADV
jgi:hypothetical protein